MKYCIRLLIVFFQMYLYLNSELLYNYHSLPLVHTIKKKEAIKENNGRPVFVWCGLNVRVKTL